jgi:glutathione peroxidase-family protein
MDAALPITLVLDKNGKTVQRFEGFTKPEDIRAAVAKAQSAG